MRARRRHVPLAAALAFVAALAVFAATRGGGEHAAAGSPALGELRPAASADGELRRLQAAVRAGAPREAELAAAYLQKARETGDPAFYARADGVLRRALASGPEDPGELIEAATLAAGRHDFRAALRLAQRARALAPDALGADPVLVDALVELGRYRAAEAALQRLVDAKPNLAAYARVSYFRELHGDLAGAAAAMRRAAAAGGPAAENVASVQALLGDLELARGRFGAARRAFATALAALPGHAGASAGRARLAAARGDLDLAITRWRSLVRRLPLPEHVTALAEAELAAADRAGRRRGAAATDDAGQRGGAAASHDADRRAGAAAPHDGAAASDDAGRRAGARLRAAARESLALVRAQRSLPAAAGVDTRVEMAVFEADHGSPRRAVTLARRGWAAAPSIRSADAVGWALTRAGRPHAGLRWARRALRLGTLDPLLRHHAGIAALAAGDRAAGRRDLWLALRHGLAAHPWQARAAREALR